MLSLYRNNSLATGAMTSNKPMLIQLTGAGSNNADSETPTGAIDDVNDTFTLANTPDPAASLELFLNGQMLTSGGIDYTLTGDQIVTVAAPLTGSILRAWYRY